MAMSTLSNEAQTVVLAALLHDIGKLAQRAGVPLAEGYRHFDRSVYGEHGAHALHSAQFVEQELADHFKGCCSPILYHHNPVDPLSRLVAAGDRFSAAERWPDRVVEDGVFQPLTNLLATVHVGVDGQPAEGGAFALSPLNLSRADSFFPSPAAAVDRARRADYAALWTGFVAEHRRLSQADFTIYLAGLYSLLQKYSWCIPSAAFRSLPDISLFDHARTAAAIAVALHSYLAEGSGLPSDADPLSLRECPCLRLIIGDLSGIQSYLYDIASTGVGGVARRLRARSLYLQLIIEVAAHRLLSALELPFLNALMTSGGRFHLLVPNTSNACQAVTALQEQADEWLLREHGGELALNLASVEFAGFEFEASQGRSGFGAVLERAGAELGQRKGKRLREALQAEGQWDERAFLLEGYGGSAACAACGKRPRTSGAELCNHCRTDWEAGRALPHASYVVFYQGEVAGDLRVLGHSVRLIPKDGGIYGSPYLVMAFREFDYKMAVRAPLLMHPICNYVPTWSESDTVSRPPVDSAEAHSGAPVTFEDLANRSQGAPLLGFLKADVDRLGEAFVFGLKPGRDTSSRLAQMSRMLDLFFSGWLPYLLESQFPDCYSVYAGGDDLLIVGPWNQIVELADRVNEDFARLVQNPELHLSAGICIARAGYPIAHAARAADEALQSAKASGRNSLCLLGHTLTWTEWRLIRSIWRDLVPESLTVASAFLYHLLTYARMWRQYARWRKDPTTGSVLGLRFQPLLAYDLGRNVDRGEAPRFHAFATDLLTLRSGDLRQRTILDNLGLLTHLWVLGRRGLGRS